MTSALTETNIIPERSHHVAFSAAEITLMGVEKCREIFSRRFSDPVLNNITFKRSQFRAIQEFINSDDFQDLFVSILEIGIDLTENDISSILEDQKTPRAAQFMSIFNTLVSNGFEGVDPRKRINFWSGTYAKDLLGATNLLTDNDVPVFCAIFLYCTFIEQWACEKGKDSVLQKGLFIKAVCTYLTTFAIGLPYACTYIAHSPYGETDPYILVGNNFWTSELPALQILRSKGHFEKIFAGFFDLHSESGWVYFNLLEQKSDQIKLLRRECTPGELDKAITWGCLKKIAEKWRKYPEMKRLSLEFRKITLAK